MNDELFDDAVDPVTLAESRLTEEQTAAMMGYYRSCILKRAGFVPHARLERADPGFTRDGLRRALFRELEPSSPDVGGRGHLDFAIREGDRVVTIDVTAVRPWEINFPGEQHTLFASNREHIASLGAPETVFIVEGFLDDEELGPDQANLVKVLGVEHADGQALHLEPMSDDDIHLKVLAVVLFDHEGNPVDGLVQLLPSRLDQVIHLPT